MNRRLFVFILSLTLILQVVLLVGCGGRDDPAQVVDEIYTAFQKKNAEKVVSLIDPVFLKDEAEKSDLNVKDFEKQLVETYKEMFATMDELISFTVGQIEVDGNEAVANVTIVQEEYGEDEVSVHMVKRDGKWYVLP